MPSARPIRSVVALCLLVSSMAAAGFEGAVDEALRVEKEIRVATIRRDGTRSADAPVWFMYDREAVYFSTLATSHKARRLRSGGAVWVTVGGRTGPTFEGWGELVSDPALIERMAAAYRQKYWIAWLGFFVPNRDRVAAGKTVIVKVTPRRPPPG